MGHALAFATIASDHTYVNGKACAQHLLDIIVDKMNLGFDDLESTPLYQTFTSRIQAVAAELGLQAGVSVATGLACASGSTAYQVTRAAAPRLARQVRCDTRKSGQAKHDMDELASVYQTHFTAAQEGELETVIPQPQALQDEPPNDNDVYIEQKQAGPPSGDVGLKWRSSLSPERKVAASALTNIKPLLETVKSEVKPLRDKKKDDDMVFGHGQVRGQTPQGQEGGHGFGADVGLSAMPARLCR